VLTGGLLAGVFFLFLLASNQSMRPRPPAGVIPAPDREFMHPDGIRPTGELMSSRLPPKAFSSAAGDAANSFREPQIAYSAELSLVTREFAHSRSSLEEILERHHGYVAKLRMVGQPAGSVLSATLRVPSSEYRSALTEFKAVGLVEHEEEAADEITQQHSELEARLVNAQNEEHRIQRLLEHGPDNPSDSAALERQVAILRGEIERIETERYASGSRVSFANVFFSLREERTSPAETIGAKLRAATVGGFSDAFESLSVILLFSASRGPLLALWAVIIYFPARYFWRRRSRLVLSEAAKNS
jgi:hypothetical protein